MIEVIRDESLQSGTLHFIIKIAYVFRGKQMVSDRSS